jgi:hypothetical protein
VRALRVEKISGLCVVTDASASRLPQARQSGAKSKAAGGNNSKKPKRRARKSAS